MTSADERAADKRQPGRLLLHGITLGLGAVVAGTMPMAEYGSGDSRSAFGVTLLLVFVGSILTNTNAKPGASKTLIGLEKFVFCLTTLYVIIGLVDVMWHHGHFRGWAWAMKGR